MVGSDGIVDGADVCRVCWDSGVYVDGSSGCDDILATDASDDSGYGGY